MDVYKLNRSALSRFAQQRCSIMSTFIACTMVAALFLLVTVEQNGQDTKIKWRLSRPAKRFYRSVTILMWAPYYEERFGQEILDFCPELKCRFTYDRDLIAESSAVVFHDRNVNVSDLPGRRLPNQHFVFFLLESPYHVSTFAFKNLSSGFYTLTMTYRRDSDVHLPYGFFKPILNPPSSAFWEDLKERIAKKKKLAVWFGTNCHTPGRREDYISQLRRYIRVDVYGLCGTRICSYESQECLHRVVSRDYKFYIAFENSVCTDYVTEKYFDRLEDYAVPVVFGRKIYEAVAPNDTFIAADDFDGPKELAKYLIYLDNNTEAYLRYFKWRQYQVSLGGQYRFSNGFCKLCQMLHDEEPNKVVTASRTASDVVSWYKDSATCYDSYGLYVHKL